jgi:hypothetical protein
MGLPVEPIFQPQPKEVTAIHIIGFFKWPEIPQCIIAVKVTANTSPT